ncbi:MAG: Hsp20/alpha crystallin family protein [Nitrososphaeraceae archaeon]
MTPSYWNSQIERWMDIFSDDEPDLNGLELVWAFDNLTRYFYTNFDENMNEWTETSQIYVGITEEVVTEETILEIPDPSVRPTRLKRTMAEFIPSTADGTKSSIDGIRKTPSEDVIVSDKNIKIVFQLPINNKKDNIKIVAKEDYSVKISYLTDEGKRRRRTLNIPYDTDLETAKATYKNGILEVKFNRQ